MQWKFSTTRKYLAAARGNDLFGNDLLCNKAKRDDENSNGWSSVVHGLGPVHQRYFPRHQPVCPGDPHFGEMHNAATTTHETRRWVHAQAKSKLISEYIERNFRNRDRVVTDTEQRCRVVTYTDMMMMSCYWDDVRIIWKQVRKEEYVVSECKSSGLLKRY